MTIKVYGMALSSYGARVLGTLEEKDVTDYELVKLDMQAGAHKKPEYLALQPFGLVPAMVDGPLTLFESRAIARYIADKFANQGTPLYGSTQKDRALVEQWLEVEGQNFNPVLTVIVSEIMKKVMMGKESDEAVIEAHRVKLCKVLDVYEVHLAKNKYLAGDFFSLADLTHSPSLSGFDYFKLRDIIDARPHVSAWYQDILSRPAWKKVSALVNEELALFEAAHKDT